MGSTRLPRKILRNFYNGDTIIEIVINNLKKVEGVPIIVATSKNHDNDELVTFLEERNISVSRGSENNVLSRFIQTARDRDLDGVIRICSDNPFLDWRGVAALIKKAKNSNADYIGYKINNTPSIKTHFGFWGEYVSVSALNRVAAFTNDKAAHEHVTIYIYSHPDEFKCEWLACPDFLQGRNDIRLTVDNEEDFENARKVYAAMYDANPEFGLVEVVKYIDSNIELQNSMKKMINNNQK